MSTAHTPGPWEYIVADGIKDAQGRRLAGLSWGRNGAISMRLTNEEAAANARLIAAAPDLLAVAERIAACYEAHDLSDILSIARQAMRVMASMDEASVPGTVRPEAGTVPGTLCSECQQVDGHAAICSQGRD